MRGCAVTVSCEAWRLVAMIDSHEFDVIMSQPLLLEMISKYELS